MNRLISLILLAFISLPAISSAETSPYFSNMIIFGDSLSDIGNFPESSKPFVNKHHVSQWHLHDEFYYVPISNPVNRKGYRVDLEKLFSLNRAYPYPWPDINEDELEIPINRNNHSLAWPEFFVNDAYDDGFTPGNRIIPSATLEANPALYANLFTSVDYAWASATTLDKCAYHKSYDSLPAKECTRRAILSARNAYVKVRSTHYYNNLIVPGVRRQVQSFLKDVKKQKVHVGPNTIYVLYAGGNDLIYDYGRFASSTYAALKNIAYDSSANIYKAALQLIQNPKVKAKHIYIVTLLDPALTPAVHEYNFVARGLAELVSEYFNFELYLSVIDINRKYPGYAVLVDGYTWYNAMRYNKKYARIFYPQFYGQACELSTVKYQRYQTPRANCKGYLFWNSIHPSMAAQQIFAYWAEQRVAHSLNK